MVHLLVKILSMRTSEICKVVSFPLFYLIFLLFVNFPSATCSNNKNSSVFFSEIEWEENIYKTEF